MTVHEFSVARSILHAVAEVRTQRQLGPIRRVTIELGEFSGVEGPLLQSAFDELIALENNRTELVIEPAALEAQCATCETTFRVINFLFRCPQCDGRDVRITRGEELRLVSVDAELEEVLS
jgi:hydrogenase nickel incorporation protein HypA/HybF